jgi:hypothetical protein
LFIINSIVVATLALGSWPRQGWQGFATVRNSAGQKRSPGVWESVRMNTHTPKWTPILGIESPGGLLKLQKVISKAKTPRLEELFISLEIYWSLDVRNGLAWPIWTSTMQVMAKKKVRSQTGSLTPNHGKSGIDPIPLNASGVQHDIIIPQSCGTPNLGDFGIPIWESQDKRSFGCHSHGVVHSILYGGRWWLPPSSGRGESCEFEVTRGLS